MLYVFRLAIFFELFVNSVNAMDPEADILEALHASGHQTVTRGDIYKMNGTGKNTQSLWYVKQKHFVCKELKNNRELQNLATLDPFVTQHEIFKETQPNTFTLHPQHISFGRYRGALKDKKGREYALFDHAEGESVLSLMIEWTQKGYNWEGNKPSYIKNQLLDHFKNVGHAIANFHLRYGTFDDKTSTFMTTTHRDLHTGNIFYNIFFSNKTTFIDYETMKSGDNVEAELKRLFEFSKKEVKKLVRKETTEIFFKKRNSRYGQILDEQEIMELDTNINTCLPLVDAFFQSMTIGYTEAFANAGYVLTNEWKVERKPFQFNQ